MSSGRSMESDDGDDGNDYENNEDDEGEVDDDNDDDDDDGLYFPADLGIFRQSGWFGTFRKNCNTSFNHETEQDLNYILKHPM